MNTPRHPIRFALVLLVLAALSAARPVRADWSLAAGGVWPDAGTPRPSASLAWRERIVASWQGEVRAHAGGVSLLARFAPGRGWRARWRPAASVGVVARDAAPRALVRVAGYEAGSSVLLPLRANAALEFSGRWVVRGDDGPRGPGRFASRWAEFTAGVTFAPEW